MRHSSSPILLRVYHAKLKYSSNKTASLAFIFFALLISVSASGDNAINAKVISVIDGNTLEVFTPEKQKLKVVLYGIDSPELGQKFGNEAKKFLEGIVLNKEVVLDVKGKDSFGNHVAIVMLDNRLDLRVELLKEGLAWTAEKNSPKDLEPYKTWAQRKARGLWQQENPVPPWTYRRQEAMATPKIR